MALDKNGVPRQTKFGSWRVLTGVGGVRICRNFVTHEQALEFQKFLEILRSQYNKGLINKKQVASKIVRTYPPKMEYRHYQRVKPVKVREDRWRVFMNVCSRTVGRTFNSEAKAKEFIDFVNDVRKDIKKWGCASKKAAHAKAVKIINAKYPPQGGVTVKKGGDVKLPDGRILEASGKVRQPLKQSRKNLAKKPAFKAGTLGYLVKQTKVNPSVRNKFLKLRSDLCKQRMSEITEAQVQNFGFNALTDHNVDFRPIWAQLSQKLGELELWKI